MRTFGFVLLLVALTQMAAELYPDDDTLVIVVAAGLFMIWMEGDD